MAGNRKTVYRSLHVKVEFDTDSYRKGIAQVALGPQLRGACRGVVAKATAYAVSISPRSRRKHKHYQDSFVAQNTTVVVPRHHPMRRVCVRLWNMSPQAAIVEWGNAATGGTRHRVLGKTLERLEHL